MDSVYLDSGNKLFAVTVSKSKLPDYRARKDRGEILPPLAYDLSIINMQRQSIQTRVDQHSSGMWQLTYNYTEPQSYGQFTNPFSAFCAECEAILGNKVLSKLKGQSAPILMLYKERKETEDMILSFLGKTRKALKVLRHPTSVFSLYRGHPPRTVRDKRFVQRMKRMLKKTKPTASAGDLWLQYRYAWSTTWMDVCDAFNALSQSRKKFSSTFVKASLPLRSWAGIQNLQCGNYKVLKGEASGSFGAHMKVQYRVDDALMAAAAELQDPVSFLYDAIPYSFVLDWVVNISGYLDLQTATAGLTYVGGYTSKFSQFLFRWEKGSKNTSGEFDPFYDYSCLTDPVKISYSKTHFNRSIMTSFPTPELEFPMKLTVNRVNDLVALIRARMSRSF